MNRLVEYLPIGVCGPLNVIHSNSSRTKLYVRFFNLSSTVVRVFWINYEGIPIEYRKLKPNQYFDCNTYENHVWIFRDAVTNDSLIGNNKEIYYTEPSLQRTMVCIRHQMKTLKFLSAKVIRDNISSLLDPFFLEVPFNLQILLTNMWIDKQFPNGSDNLNIFTTEFCVKIGSSVLNFSHTVESLAAEKGNREDIVLITEILKKFNRLLECCHGSAKAELPPESIAAEFGKMLVLIIKRLQFLHSTSDLRFDGTSFASYSALISKLETRRRTVPPIQREFLLKYYSEQLNSFLDNLRDFLNEDNPVDLGNETAPPLLDDHLINNGELHKVVMLENIFQVVCIFYKHITGNDLSLI